MECWGVRRGPGVSLFWLFARIRIKSSPLPFSTASLALPSVEHLREKRHAWCSRVHVILRCGASLLRHIQLTRSTSRSRYPPHAMRVVVPGRRPLVPPCIPLHPPQGQWGGSAIIGQGDAPSMQHCTGVFRSRVPHYRPRYPPAVAKRRSSVSPTCTFA